jgi:hypothetical protein
MITYLNINMHGYISWFPAQLTDTNLAFMPWPTSLWYEELRVRQCDIDQVNICARELHDPSIAGGIASWIAAGRRCVFDVCQPWCCNFNQILPCVVLCFRCLSTVMLQLQSDASLCCSWSTADRLAISSTPVSAVTTVPSPNVITASIQWHQL